MKAIHYGQCGWATLRAPDMGFEDDVAAAPPVAAVGATVGQALGPEEMVRTGSTFTRAAVDFDVVDEVIGSQFFELRIKN